MATHQSSLQVDHELIAHLALSAYHQLPPRGGKPGIKSNNRIEWTVLAAFILSYPATESRQYTLISLATGLKCLPFTLLPAHGDVLHDQHAEVLARRGARSWLLHRLEQEVDSGELKLFQEAEAKAGKRWRLSQGVRLHLYVSTLPCGDASSKLLDFQRAAQDVLAATPNAPTPTELLASDTQTSSSSSCTSSSIVRGRASSTHHLLPAASLRTKPGRPDSPPSISMSCSDKIALCNAPGIGMQGSLLSSLMEPIYIHSLTMCDHPTRHIFPAFPWTPPDQEIEFQEQARQALKHVLAQDCRRALQRARPIDDPHPIIVGWSTVAFVDSRESRLEFAWSTLSSSPVSDSHIADGKVPNMSQLKSCEPVSCPNSILYIRDSALQSKKGRVENLASGTKMGAPTRRTKSQIDGQLSEPLKPPARSWLCRLNFFQSFVAAYDSITGIAPPPERKSLLYRDAKQGAFGEGSKAYTTRKAELLGGTEDAQKRVQQFLAGARHATAIKATMPTNEVQNTIATREPGESDKLNAPAQDASVFTAWLRTPVALSQFDLRGHTAQAQAQAQPPCASAPTIGVPTSLIPHHGTEQ
ncbi:tRNA-specific adenosine deaminase [Mycosarcoma maydis]|uniref:A to I editase domain-containing protein n=1 Tax=Mycosarcoma maydis TaxID=5270 RepID=A0A0D1BVX2_MYCMD|nr:tRNA-specific adenosine deaminase [Ustilago maydis 521]KIS66157.1 hypothetical protein UMAG_05895 [Ustilago maydis 521]|eukprot:XP_011392240.1 hypothetical protein UMAG_05895 [Ustilago maydis 521]